MVTYKQLLSLHVRSRDPVDCQLSLEARGACAWPIAIPRVITGLKKVSKDWCSIKWMMSIDI